jgi:caffeoyl-CoA O-methyltransferase
MSKPFSASNPEIEKYVESVFQPEDSVLREIRVRAAKMGLPDIHIGPMDGLHLEVLARSMSARKVVEIGTLAGYSGVCLARGLSDNGRLYTFEYEPKHAEIALESFVKAGLSKRVQIFVGAALQNLSKVEAEGPFDIVFIDADKQSYSAYYEWAVKNLRKGGALLADNTFAMGEIAEPASQDKDRVKAIQKFNKTAATDSRMRATILPTSDGLTFAVKR